MQYILIVLAFTAVVVGVFGDPWDKELRRLTPLGWAIIIIALGSAIGSSWTTYSDHKKIEWQKAQQGKIREVAATELREALRLTLHPFESVFHNHEYKGESLDFDSERASRDLDYLIEEIRSTGYKKALSQIDLRRDANVYPKITWGNWFSWTATNTNEMLEALVQKYSAYLDADTLLNIHALQTDNFFRGRLRELPTLVEANEHVDEYRAATAFLGPVAELFRSFDLVFCRKGETSWHRNQPGNFAQKQCA